MTDNNRYKFKLGERQLIVNTHYDNLFMQAVQDILSEKYQAISHELPDSDAETKALLLAINAISVQLEKEIGHLKEKETALQETLD